MKYNIHGFNQPRAVELNLTNDDLLVLRWFVDFAGTKKMKTIIEEDGIYYWVNYTTVLEDLPVLKISKQTLKRKHFDNLCNSNVLKHKHIKDGGSFSYYAYGINYDALVYLQDSTPTSEFTNPTSEFTKGCVEIYQGVGQNLPNKDYFIKDYSIKDINCSSIYDFIENNFARTLSAIEYEEISKWEDNELTRYAIKQAVLNGKYNIKYISRILENYKIKNIKTIQEAQQDENNFKKQKETRHKTSKEKMDEVFERFLNAEDEEE